MHAQPQPQHLWLHKLVGEWVSEAECDPGPGKPAEKTSGTESVRKLGELWVLAEGRGTMPGGGAAQMLITLGFDPGRQRFTGTWIGSMTAWLWVYEGTLDAAQRVLTLECQGPDFNVEGKLAKYRDVIEWIDDGHRLLHSSVLGDDGNWTRFMTAHYLRRT